MVTQKGNVVTFSAFCGGAEQVFVFGDFNNWSTTAHAMEPCGGGRWRAELKLPPGDHRFGYFVINGRRGHDAGLGLTSLRADGEAASVRVPHAPHRN